MTQEDKELLLKDLCARLPYGLVLDIDTTDWKAPQGHIQLKIEGIGILFKDMSLIANGCYYGDNYKPYLRPMSSMSEEERKELLCTVIGKDAAKYFQVLSDGSIDNTDSAYQDLQNFTMHWVNFDGSNTSSYIDWLNAHHFDYRGLIEKGLAIEVNKNNNPYEN